MTTPTALSRRQLLVEGAAAFASPFFVPSQALGKPHRPGANDRIRLGFIGVGRRKQQLLEALAYSRQVLQTSLRPRHKPRGSCLILQR